MAKAQTTVDEELAKLLKQARLRPRNFALFASGTNCLRLILSRKPIPATLLSQTKKEANARRVYQGVCEGKGATQLAFRLCEQPSVTQIKLRKYLTEHAGVAIHPLFEIVEDIIEVDEIGDEPGEVAPNIAQAAVKIDSAKKRQLRDALVKIVPSVQRVLRNPVTPVAVNEELQDLVVQLKSDVADLRFDSAKAAVAKIVPIVKQYAPQTAETDEARSAGAVDYAKARLAWNAAYKKARADLEQLKAAMLQRCNEDPELERYRIAVDHLHELLAPFENELPDKLDEALNEADPSARQRLHNEAADLIRRNLAVLEDDKFLKATDSNDVLPVPIFSTLFKTLNVLAKTIAKE